jgi:hypothetical protein
MKTCKRCGHERPVDEFPWRNRRHNTRQTYCRECWPHVRNTPHPTTCKRCGTVLKAAKTYCYPCEPTTCECPVTMPATDGMGDCTNCHRLTADG